MLGAPPPISHRKDLRAWVAGLPDDIGVFIDEGGLTLISQEDEDNAMTTLEVGWRAI